MRKKTCLLAVLVIGASFSQVVQSQDAKTKYMREKIAAMDEAKLEQLAKRIDLDSFKNAIHNGDQKIFATLPAKGYKNGFADVLKKFHLVVNPKYSFAECDYDSRVYSPTTYGQGCRISLKLARKTGGELVDTGIRVEWSRDLKEKSFVPNNSVWATHITNGDGILELNVSGR